MDPSSVPRRPTAAPLLGSWGWLVVGVVWSAAVGVSLLISVVVLPTATVSFVASHALSYLLGLVLFEGMWLAGRSNYRITHQALHAARVLEKALANTRAEAVHLMDAGVPMTITDLDFTTIRANQAYLDLTGLQPKDVIGKACHELHHNCVCETEDCPLEKIMEGVRVTQLDVTLNVNGKTIPATATATPLLDHKGRLLGMIEVFCDNRELARTRGEVSRLRAEMARLRSDSTLRN